jgi:hypothetical protein
MKTNKENSAAYLKSVLKKGTGFKTPENYFSGVENRFSSFLSEEKIPKKAGFNAPDRYFDNLENLILSKVSSTKKDTKIISFKDRVLKIVPFVAAASILLFIGLNSFVFEDSKNISLDDISENEVENWISYNINSLSEDDVMYAYTDINFSETDVFSSSINYGEIENYVIEEDNLYLILEND